MSGRVGGFCWSDLDDETFSSSESSDANSFPAMHASTIRGEVLQAMDHMWTRSSNGRFGKRWKCDNGESRLTAILTILLCFPT